MQINKYKIFSIVRDIMIFDSFKKKFHMKYMNDIPFAQGGSLFKKSSFEESNNIISQYIESKKPFMLSRYGFTELRVLFSNSDRLFNQLVNNAGFFPNDKNIVEHFRECYKQEEKNIDILLPWSYFTDFKDRERQRIANLDNIKYFCDFNCSGTVIGTTKGNKSKWQEYQYFIENSWTKYLANKKILIIHPFKESIEEQYQTLLRKNLLPKFSSFTVLEAVQSVGGKVHKNNNFKDWFEALDFMKSQIKSIDFDIALIGCGAYGLPLASFIKKIGKQSLHLGGGLQLLFAIKGQRWEEEQNKLFLEEIWVTPKISERPDNFKTVESGCYW